jgi:hypothetical protein
MPVPLTSLITAEIIANGVMAAGGSNNKLTSSVFHYQRSNPALPLTEGHCEAAFQTAIMVPIAAALNSRWHQTGNIVRFMEDPARLSVLTSRAVAGTQIGDSMVSELFAFLLMKCAVRGKLFRGNKKLFPMSEGDTTSGSDDIWNAGCLTRLGTIATALLATFTDSDGNVWTPVILSKKLSQVQKLPVTIAVAAVSQVLVRKTPGSSKRRKVKNVY